jgi:hypothetical protein
MNRLTMKKILIAASVALTIAVPVQAAETDNSERIFQATFANNFI